MTRNHENRAPMRHTRELTEAPAEERAVLVAARDLTTQGVPEVPNAAVKASNTGSFDVFGAAAALSSDTLALTGRAHTCRRRRLSLDFEAV